MKGIFDRLLEVAHWGAFFWVPVRVGVDVKDMPEGSDWVAILVIWAASIIASAIILYILKGRLILFPWWHRK